MTPPSSSDSLTHTYTHTHVNPHLLCQPPCKVDPYYPPSQTCSALSTSSGQLQTKKPEMWGVSATWPGSANPLILALSFLLSPSFLCPQRKKRKNCNFFIACKLAFSSLLSSLLLSLSFFHAFVRAPTWAWWGSPCWLAGVPERLKKRWRETERERARRERWRWGLDWKREGGVRNWDKRKGACEWVH